LDILPEYYKSEITLGLSDPSDRPRIEPYLADYGSAGETFATAAASQPDVTYGVPAAPPLISLSDYNIPEVSDKGFKSVGGSSSYGR